MDDEDAFVLGKADFHDHTTVHPLGLSVLMLLGFAMLTLPRRRAMISVVICASFIAVGQRVVVFTLDFNFLRLMVIFGWMRIILQKEFRGFRWQSIDRWVLAWAIAALAIYPISHGAAGIVYKLGTTFESLGMFFLVRMLVRDLDDVQGLIESFAIVSIPLVVLFLVERTTQKNLFSIFGGVPEITMIREGKIRCQGAYAHPILAGCFWAAILPLFVGRIFSPGVGRSLALIGLFTSLAVVAMCSSSTPIVGVISAVAGFLVFPLRKSMRLVRWSIVLILFCLHMCMKNPVWHLISRTDLIGGSTGWHRFFVIDQSINHFREWAVFGINDITHWDIFANDITNHYVLEGIRGGFLSLFLFLMMIAVAFGNIGRLWRQLGGSPGKMLLAWSIGVSLFVHTVNFFGVSYFGQIDMLWYIGLALTAVTANNSIPELGFHDEDYCDLDLSTQRRLIITSQDLVRGIQS